MKTNEKICRFCFKVCCNFETIDGDIKDVSDVLLPAIDIAAIRKPVMCIHCEEILFMCFDFKARCLDTHDYLVPFANKKDDGVKLKLKEIYMAKNKNNIVPEDQDICVLCMCPVKKCFAIFLGVGERAVMLRKSLKQCLPELDLSIIEEPVICAPCHASLEINSRFVTKVLNGEEKIRKYKESLGINSKSRIDLSSLGQSILGEVDGNGGDVTELEKRFDNHSESVDKEVERKCNIDDLKFNNEQNLTPTNTLDCKIEGNEIGTIKIEETSCAEDGTEVGKENIVEAEDRKMLMDEEIEIKSHEVDFNSFEDDIAMTQLDARLNGKQEYPIMPNFEENLLELHIDQTCVNKNIPKTKTYLHECGPFKTENKYHLKTHLRKHMNPSEVTMHRCDSCAYQTMLKGYLKKHMLKHKDISEVTMYTCDSCAYQTKLKPVLKRHLLKHKNLEVPKHKCGSCAYQTIHKSALKIHVLKHKDISEVAMYNCYSCSFQTKHKSNLNAHLLKHKDISEVTMYKCDLCLYQSRYKSELKKHLARHKNPSEVTMHKCNVCAHQTKDKSSLKKHVLKHKDISEVTMYKCDSCLYQSRYKSSLKIHLRKHKNLSEVTMYRCDSCAFQTGHKCVLKVHLLKHKDISEVTMYSCYSCSYQTKYKASLYRHMLQHKNPSEVTMYTCDLCLYQTKYSRHLKRHLITHENPSS